MDAKMPEGWSELLAEVAKQQEKVAAFGKRVESATGKASSPKGTLTVKVDGRGEITELKFGNRDYTRMSPQELSRLVLDTISKARKAAREQIREAADGVRLPGGVPVDDLRKGTVDLAKLLPTGGSFAPKDLLEFFRGGDTEKSR